MASYFLKKIGDVTGYTAEVEKAKYNGLVAFHSLSTYSVRRENELKATVSDLEGRVCTYRKELQDLKAEQSEAEARYRDGMEGAGAELAKARRKIEVCEGVIAQLEGDLVAAGLQLKTAEREVARLMAAEADKTLKLNQTEDALATERLKARKAEKKARKINARAEKTHTQLRALDKALDKARMANARAAQLVRERDEALKEAAGLRVKLEDAQLDAYLKGCELGHLQVTLNRQAASIRDFEHTSAQKDLKIAELQAKLNRLEEARTDQGGEAWGEGGQQAQHTFGGSFVKAESLMDVDDEATLAPVAFFASAPVPCALRKRGRDEEVVGFKDEDPMTDGEDEEDGPVAAKRTRRHY